MVSSETFKVTSLLYLHRLTVTVPWGVGGAYVPPAPSSSEGGSPQPSNGYSGGDNGGWSDPPSSGTDNSPAAMWGSTTATVGNVANVGVGTVVPLGTDTNNADVAPQQTDSAGTPGTQDSSDPSKAPPGGFVSDGQLGGAAGKL